MYYVVLPYVINFMLTQYAPPDIEKTLRSSDYLERILQLVFAFGFAFEMPVLLILLVRVGIATTEGLRVQAALRHRDLLRRRRGAGAARRGQPDRARRCRCSPSTRSASSSARGSRRSARKRTRRPRKRARPTRQLAMHDIRFIRENPAAFDAGLKKRNLAPLSAELLEIDKRRRAAISESEASRPGARRSASQIGIAKRKGEPADALMAEVAALEESPEEGRGRGGRARCRADAPPRGAAQPAVRRRAGRHRRDRQCRDPPGRQPAQLRLRAQGPRRAGRGDRRDGLRRGRKMSGARFVVPEEAGSPGSSAPSRSSCSTCTPRRRAATPRSIRRSWCATTPPTASASCRASPRTCSTPTTASG